MRRLVRDESGDAVLNVPGKVWLPPGQCAAVLLSVAAVLLTACATQEEAAKQKPAAPQQEETQQPDVQEQSAEPPAEPESSADPESADAGAPAASNPADSQQSAEAPNNSEAQQADQSESPADQGAAGSAGSLPESDSSPGAVPPSADSSAAGDVAAGADKGAGSAVPDASVYVGEAAELDRVFNKSLGEYDGAIADEQETLATSGQGSGRAAGNRESQDAAAVAGGATMPEQPGIGAGSDGSNAGTVSEGVAGGSGSSVDALSDEERRERIPEDIPVDGTGEDVIARQIRELAMQEEDAELREAIWDEYRTHTGMTQ